MCGAVVDYVFPHFIVDNETELGDDRAVIVPIPNHHAVTVWQASFRNVEPVFGGYVGNSEGAEVKKDLTFRLRFEFSEEFFVNDWDEFSAALVKEDTKAYSLDVSAQNLESSFVSGIHLPFVFVNSPPPYTSLR